MARTDFTAQPGNRETPSREHEREVVDETLKASEQRYRRLFETAKDGILLLDYETGQIVDSNPFLRQLLGYSTDELLGKELWEIGVFKQIAASKKAFTKLQAQEYIRYDHMPLEHKDGRHVDVEFVSNVYRVEGTKVIQCNIRDISARKIAEDALEHSLSLLRATLESAADGIEVVNRDGKIEIFNQKFIEMWRIPPAVIAPRDEEAVIACVADQLDDANAFRARIRSLQAHPETESFDVLRFKDGRIFERYSRPQTIAGKCVGLVWSFCDVTARMQTEAVRAQLAAIVESSDDGIFSKTLDGVIVSWNKGAERLYGYGAEEIKGQSVSILIPPERSAESSQIIEKLRRGQHVQHYETVRVHKDGRRINISLTASPMRDSISQEITGVSVVARDITEKKRSESRMLHMAQHDALTGLPNRTLFRDRLSQAIAYARRGGHQVAVLFIDLDHFKDINDSLGHQVGDHLLRMTAERLQHCLREGDTIARLGGDEFVVSLPVLADSTAAMTIAGKILEALREPFLVDTHELHVGGSIGISLYPIDGEDTDTLMRAADTAMYHAKDRGRDGYQFFTSQLNDAAQRRLLIGGRLHQALKNGEFTLNYQPQVDLGSGKIFAAEALLRWEQFDLGPIPVSEFIKIAEDTGSISAIGEWVLREACRQACRWRDSGYPAVKIAVNFSPQQFHRAGFAELTEKVLKETGLAADTLEIELTEGVLMTQSHENVSILEQLVAMGVRLTVDDFGTGYSSLAYLQRFPVNTLKIDRSFVGGIGRDAGDTTIVAAIIAMAESLNLRVIAEGVETREQVTFLKSHGCHAAQGFYFSKAVTDDDFVKLLSNTAYAVSYA